MISSGFLVARNALRILIGLSLAVAFEHVRPGVISVVTNLGPPAFAVAQVPGNYYPPGYDPNLPAGYSDPTGVGANNADAFGVNNYGPSSPTAPTNPPRPAGWPGAAPNAAAQLPDGALPPPVGVNAPAAAPVPFKDPTEPPYEPAAILAHVGSEVVQASEILPAVHQTLDAYLERVEEQLAKAPDDFKEKQIAQWHRELVKRTLDDTIKIKLLIADIRATAPKEGVEKNVSHMRKGFNESEIKRLKELYKATSVVDLENKLRQQGGSLESQRMAYVDRNMAIGWAMSQIKEKKEPSHEEMVNYYREHIAQWGHPARSRWEQLTAQFDKFPSRAEAWRAIAAWGTQIQNGAPFAEVARANSHGFAAEEGGLNDWTTHGSLRSTVIEQAIFGLPVGVLSQILADEEGFHIVRVVEREEQHTTPFIEVQPEIKKKLHEGGKLEAMNEYIEALRQRTPVHTIFDADSPLASRPDATVR
ncbi:MAG: peptidyl-prolyl cis-trans isomerase [Pirellulales bacterium]